MSKRTVIVLGNIGQLARDLRAALSRADIVQTNCLDRVPRPTRLRHAEIIVASDTIPNCCIEKLKEWKSRSSSGRCQVSERSCQHRVEPRRGSADEAWRERDRLLSTVGVGSKTREFIVRARQHEHEWFTVQEAADALGQSSRQMRRIIERDTGYSPHMLLHLARIASIAREISRSNTPLKDIAQAHRFADLPSMSRQFKRFVGMPPGRYRSTASALNGRNSQCVAAERVY